MKTFDYIAWQKGNEEQTKKNREKGAAVNKKLRFRSYKFRAECKADVAKLLKQKDFGFREMKITVVTLYGWKMG
jgi:hypothetical protein